MEFPGWYFVVFWKIILLFGIWCLLFFSSRVFRWSRDEEEILLEKRKGAENIRSIPLLVIVNVRSSQWLPCSSNISRLFPPLSSTFSSFWFYQTSLFPSNNEDGIEFTRPDVAQGDSSQLKLTCGSYQERMTMKILVMMMKMMVMQQVDSRQMRMWMWRGWGKWLGSTIIYCWLR